MNYKHIKDIQNAIFNKFAFHSANYGEIEAAHREVILRQIQKLAEELRPEAKSYQDHLLDMGEAVLSALYIEREKLNGEKGDHPKTGNRGCSKCG